MLLGSNQRPALGLRRDRCAPREDSGFGAGGGEVHADRARTPDPVRERPAEGVPDALMLVSGDVALRVDDLAAVGILEPLRDRDLVIAHSQPGRVGPEACPGEPFVPERAEGSLGITIGVVEPDRRVVQSVQRVERFHFSFEAGHHELRKSLNGCGALRGSEDALTCGPTQARDKATQRDKRSGGLGVTGHGTKEQKSPELPSMQRDDFDSQRVINV